MIGQSSLASGRQLPLRTNLININPIPQGTYAPSYQPIDGSRYQPIDGWEDGRRIGEHSALVSGWPLPSPSAVRQLPLRSNWTEPMINVNPFLLGSYVPLNQPIDASRAMPEVGRRIGALSELVSARPLAVGRMVEQPAVNPFPHSNAPLYQPIYESRGMPEDGRRIAEQSTGRLIPSGTNWTEHMNEQHSSVPGAIHENSWMIGEHPLASGRHLPLRANLTERMINVNSYPYGTPLYPPIDTSGAIRLDGRSIGEHSAQDSGRTLAPRSNSTEQMIEQHLLAGKDVITRTNALLDADVAGSSLWNLDMEETFSNQPQNTAESNSTPQRGTAKRRTGIQKKVTHTTKFKPKQAVVEIPRTNVLLGADVARTSVWNLDMEETYGNLTQNAADSKSTLQRRTDKHRTGILQKVEYTTKSKPKQAVVEVPQTSALLDADVAETSIGNLDMDETLDNLPQNTGDSNSTPQRKTDKHRTGVQKKVKHTTKFKQKKATPYTEAFLQSMLSNVKNGMMSKYHVNKYYGIPRGTLQYRLGARYKNKGRRGPDTKLSVEEENIIVEWLQGMEKRGFPITQRALVIKVAAYLRQKQQTNRERRPIIIPGRKWIEGFKKRHPTITLRTPESITSASSKVSEEDIRKWFQSVENYLIEHNLTDILKDPSRILNGDETGFCMNATPKKVLATKGAKNVPSVDTANGKQNVTVLFSFAADGTVIPPDVILPYKRLSRDIVQSFTEDWGLGTSESGWMNAQNFTWYITKVLHRALVKKGVQFPVLYFVDNHKSHTAYEVADACEKLGIILIGLFPNATRIIQPADVSIFRPVKNSWGKQVEIWKTDHAAERLTIPTFANLLRETMADAFKTTTIVNAFRACGLFPFNPDAVDYSKCIPSNRSQHKPQDEPDFQTANASTLPVENTLMTLVPTQSIETALRMISDEKVARYKFGDQNSFSDEDKVISYIYKNILTAGQSDNDEAASNCEHNEPIIILEEKTDLGLQLNHEPEPCGDSDPNTLQDPDQDDDHNSNNDTDEVKESEVQWEPSDSADVSYNCEPSLEASSNVDVDFEAAFNAPILTLDEEAELELNPESESYGASEPDTFEDLDQDDANDFNCDIDGRVPEAEVQSEPEMQKAAASAEMFDNATTIETLVAEPTKMHPMSAEQFFKTPPTPRRNPKHRFYKQTSYVVLTAGERLAEMRRIELNKAEAAKLKIQRAEKRKEDKLKKEEEKENAKKARKLKKEATAKSRAEMREKSKIEKEKQREKKKIEMKTAKRCGKKMIV